MAQKKHLIHCSTANIDILAEHLTKYAGTTDILFCRADPDFPSADYGCAIQPMGNNMFSYQFGGHGIGTNHRPDGNLDEILSRVLRDHSMHGYGSEFTIMYYPISA
ncbi:hypothetical protein [Rubritalea tangerina]